MGLLARYRGTGADLPGQDPGRAHPGVAREGYFWRVTGLVVRLPGGRAPRTWPASSTGGSRARRRS